MDCDDEYWKTEDPEQAFKQPEGVPSKVSAFVHLIGLVRLLGMTLRSIVSFDPTCLPLPKPRYLVLHE